MSIVTIYCNVFRKVLSQQLLLEISLLRFHSVSALQFLDCYYNEYPVTQTAS